MNNEQEIRQAFADAAATLSKFQDFGHSGFCKMLEMVASFPNSPVEVRASGASGKEPAKYFTDLTFQEFIQMKWTEEDPRPSHEVILEKAKAVIELAEWADFVVRNRQP